MSESKNQKKGKRNYKFKAELEQLLHLIAHSLYTHPEIFLRELISNASDALNKVRFEQLTNKEIINPDEELAIRIEVDKDKQLFSIEDSGIGMTREELIHNIGTVAKSGTLNFVEQIQKEGKVPDGDMIGQFGVGFYSVFMVTDEVIVETRHASPDSVGYRWRSEGKGSFSIEETDRTARGTRISFRLKDDHKDFAEEYRVRSVIEKYSNFVDFPIYLGKEKINKIEALWRKSKDDLEESELNEFYKFVGTDYEAPLGHLHISLEGAVNFKALLFIPSKAPMNLFYDTYEKGVHLYANRVFIQDDNKDLLPEYFKFVKGVVDTEDLPLNVSREVTQHSPVMAKIRDIVTTKLLGMLEEWSRKDPGKFEKFHKEFGTIFKSGVNTDFKNKDKIVKLLRFESTRKAKGELVSLDDYVNGMQEDQKEIYYLSGESREIIEKNPNLEYFRKNDIEVLLLTDPVDVFVLPNIDDYEKKKVVSIEKADLDLKESKVEGKEEDGVEKKALKSLIKIFKDTLGDKVEDVRSSKRLVESPATLVVSKDGLDPRMERMMRMLNQEVKSQKRILEINPNHHIIRNLSRLNLGDSSDPLLRKTVLQLYETALLMDGNLENPTDFVQRAYEFIEKATD